MRVAASRLSSAVLCLACLAAGCQDVPRQPAAGPMAAAVVVTPPALTLRAGESAQLSAQANDAVGQPIGGAALEWSSAEPSLLRVSATGLVTSTGLAGKGRVAVASGARRAEVAVEVLAGRPARVELAGGAGQTAAAGTLLPEPITVRVLDAYANGVGSTGVIFATAEGGTLVPARTATDAGGLAASSWTLGPVPGAQRAMANVEGEPALAAAFPARATPGRPARLAAMPQGGDALVAGAEATLEVRVLDAGGHGVPGVEVRWRSLSHGGDVSPPASVTGPEGRAATRLRTASRAGRNRVEARAEGVEAAVLEATTVRRARPPLK